MMKKTMKIKLAGLILGGGLMGLAGCGTSPGFLNPFTLLSSVTSVDSTGFFVDIYSAILRTGISVANSTTTTTDTTTTGTTGTTGITIPTTTMP